jgi:hypothetical protein
MAQEIRRQAFQGAVDGWRAQQAAAAEAAQPQPSWGVGVAAPRGGGVMYLEGTYYSVRPGKKAADFDAVWAQQSKADKKSKDGKDHNYNQYEYAKGMLGRDPVNLNFGDIERLFGRFHVVLTADADGSEAHYIGDATKTGTFTIRTPGGYFSAPGKKTITGAADKFFVDGFRLATPGGVVDVAKFLYVPDKLSAGYAEGSGAYASIAQDMAAIAAKSAADRALPQGVGWDICGAYGGDLTKTQAQSLDSVGQCTGCCTEIKNFKLPEPCPSGYDRSVLTCQAGQESAPGRPECIRCKAVVAPCPEGFKKYIGMIGGGSPCKAGETIEYADGRRCYKCNAAKCSTGYSVDEPLCEPGYRREPDPKVAGCWQCKAACPGGSGWTPPDKAACPPAQQKPDTYHKTGCVICAQCPPDFQFEKPSCPAGQISKPDRATGCWGPCAPACPEGYYVLPAGAPFTCPPWQQRKVDQVSGCVACETAANCFPTTSGLACGPGQTPQNYGAFTCCQAPAAPPPSAAPPSTEPAASPEKPPGAEEPAGTTKAGIGIGGGLAIAGIAIGILYAIMSGGKEAAGAASAAAGMGGRMGGGSRGPTGRGPDAERPRGLAGMRGKFPR